MILIRVLYFANFSGDVASAMLDNKTICTGPPRLLLGFGV